MTFRGEDRRRKDVMAPFHIFNLFELTVNTNNPTSLIIQGVAEDGGDVRGAQRFDFGVLDQCRSESMLNRQVPVHT